MPNIGPGLPVELARDTEFIMALCLGGGELFQKPKNPAIFQVQGGKDKDDSRRRGKEPV